MDPKGEPVVRKEKSVERNYVPLRIPRRGIIRDIVDTLIARKDEAEYDYHVNSYMAGMLDASYKINKEVAQAA